MGTAMNLPFALPGARSSSLKPKVPDVNLFPQDPFYSTFFGKILRWAVSVGRHIVIFTEIVVIGSFFSRFVLDRQVTDLNSSILQKQSIAESYGTLDADIREIQRRTKDISDILAQQGRYDVLNIITKITPPEIVYDQISLSGERMSLSGRSRSGNALSALIAGLQQHPQFQSITIGDISSGETDSLGETLFSVTMVYRQGLVAEQTVKSTTITPVRPVGQ
jgi:Tfp pilus assembly protein PilN